MKIPNQSLGQMRSTMAKISTGSLEIQPSERSTRSSSAGPILYGACVGFCWAAGNGWPCLLACLPLATPLLP